MTDSAPFIPIMTAVIAATSALSGAILSNMLSRRDRAAERAIRARQDAQTHLLSRGEDLFLYLAKLDRYVADHVDIIEQFCHGHIDRQSFQALRSEVIDDFEELELGRIHLSVSVFFPDLLPLYLESMTNLNALKTIDGVLFGSAEPSSSVVYRISADAVRLRKVSRSNAERFREAVSGILRETFQLRHSLESVLPGPAAETTA
ncbi:MAG TPA: hypothetical protein VF470_05825 [Sphingomicrobium sp.]